MSFLVLSVWYLWHVWHQPLLVKSRSTLFLRICENVILALLACRCPDFYTALTCILRLGIIGMLLLNLRLMCTSTRAHSSNWVCSFRLCSCCNE